MLPLRLDLKNMPENEGWKELHVKQQQKNLKNKNKRWETDIWNKLVFGQNSKTLMQIDNIKIEKWQ